LKILITSIVDLRKGPHTRLHEFIRHLKINHDITVLCINDWWKSGQTDSQLYEQGHSDALEEIRIEYFTYRRISPIRQELTSAISIGKLLEKVNFSSFNVHLNYNSLISGYFVARKMRSINVATVYDIADNLPEMIRVSPQVPAPMRFAGSLLGRLMLRKNVNIARKVSFVNTNIKDIYPAPSEKAVVIPNGVDVDKFYPRSPELLREKLGLGENFIIGFVGTMREWVDFDPVFAAVSDLINQHPNIKFVIVGEEGGLETTRNEAKKYGILDRIVFIGTVPYDQVPDYISCMDLCLIPFAKYKGMDAGPEGFCPLKLAEYLACEKPVISSQKTSMPEDIVFYASSMQEYKDVIIQLYNNPQLGKEMGAKGRKVIQGSYLWSSSASTLEKVLLEVAA
jgi:glycosyltransferase involved in cell wall biosynthesis